MNTKLELVSGLPSALRNGFGVIWHLPSNLENMFRYMTSVLGPPQIQFLMQENASFYFRFSFFVVCSVGLIFGRAAGSVWL